MIIRSQDKKAITDDLKLYIRENDFTRDKVKWEIRNAEQDLLATYSTEKKAIKVLDMICEAYSRCESTKELASGILLEAAKRFTQNEAEEFKKEHRANFMFQMPQDSEV